MVGQWMLICVPRSRCRTRGGLPAEVLDGLLMGSTGMRVPAGSVTHWEGEPDPHLELVVSGVVRVFVTAPDGRTMTVRSCRPGALIGVMS